MHGIMGINSYDRCQVSTSRLETLSPLRLIIVWFVVGIELPYTNNVMHDLFDDHLRALYSAVCKSTAYYISKNT